MFRTAWLVAFGCAWAQRPPQQDVARGRALFNRSCTVCHGLDGAAGDRAPALAGTRRFARTTEDELFEVIKLGIPGTLMPATPLDDRDIRRIVAYIRGLRATAYDVAVAGDITRGEAVFFGKGDCGRCHRIRGRGGFLGPDLSDVAAERSLRALRQALVEPKPHVPRGYQPARLVTLDGRAIAGILRNENNFSVQLLDVEGRLHLFLRDELAEVQYERHSLMPADYDQRLARREFEDLLAFLSRQAVSRGRFQPKGASR